MNDIVTHEAAPAYEIVSPDGTRETVSETLGRDNIPVTPETASLTKKKLQALTRYRKALTRAAELEKRRPNRIKKSRARARLQKASRRANWR
jgi:hypothetical protein